MKKRVFGLLNPKNLQREVHIYGYHFSRKSQLLISIGALAGMAALGILFKLSFFFTVIILSVTVVLLPMLILNVYKHMYEQKRFADVTTYIEQLMYSFQKKEKVKLALLECAEAFGEGEMKAVLERAVAYINKGKAKTEGGILKEAFEMIEKSYPCRRIHLAHKLLAHVEADGGESYNSIALILEDTENWKKRVYKLHAEKKRGHMDNIISIIIATILCALCLYVIDYMRILFHAESVVNIFDNRIVQISSELFILFSMYVFAKSSGNLTGDWIKEEKIYNNEKISKMYREVKEYDDRKEAKRSVFLTIPFFLAAVCAYLLHNKWLCILLLFVTAFVLFQHKIGHKLVVREVMNEMHIAFPEWLMQMALLLQNNNVQVSVITSAEHAPAVLKPELTDLIERMGKEPDKLETYTKFCSDFQMPEALSCMKMLHSISESGIGDAEVQIRNILGHINKMQEQADHLLNENVLFKMRMIFSYPVFAAAVKMLIDMTIGMFVLFQIMGNMEV